MAAVLHINIEPNNKNISDKCVLFKHTKFKVKDCGVIAFSHEGNSANFFGKNPLSCNGLLTNISDFFC